MHVVLRLWCRLGRLVPVADLPSRTSQAYCAVQRSWPRCLRHRGVGRNCLRILTENLCPVFTVQDHGSFKVAFCCDNLPSLAA